MAKGWKTYLLYSIMVIVVGSLLFLFIETFRLKNTGFEGKTLWDWMELLIIPTVLAGGAFYLNRSERAVERQIAEEHAKLEREIATDRQQEAALQSYIDQMAHLLLKENLRTSGNNNEVRMVARTRTLTVLRVLDANRKGLVINFLHESNLIISPDPIVILASADLSGASLRGILHRADLSGANMQGADLLGIALNEASLQSANMQGANLQDAELQGANLQDAHFRGANLSRANLKDAYFRGASLRSADLQYADLRGANLEDTNLEGINLKGATMPDGTKHQ